MFAQETNVDLGKWLSDTRNTVNKLRTLLKNAPQAYGADIYIDIHRQYLDRIESCHERRRNAVLGKSKERISWVDDMFFLSEDEKDKNILFKNFLILLLNFTVLFLHTHTLVAAYPKHAGKA